MRSGLGSGLGAELGLGYTVGTTAPVRIKGPGLGLGLESGTGSRRRLAFSLGYWAAASSLDHASPIARPTMRKATALDGSEAAWQRSPPRALGCSPVSA